MKKKLQFSPNLNVSFFLFLTVLFLGYQQTNAQTTAFTDDFNRAALSPGGTPSMNYTLTPSTSGIISTPATGVGVNDFAGNPDSRVKIGGGLIAGTEQVVGSMTGVAGYNTTLHSNTQLVTWSFNLKHNRSTATMSGFDTTPTAQYGAGIVLACDKPSPLDPAAKGYAVVMGGVGTKNTYDLVSFQNGMGATINLTVIIPGITLVTIKEVVSINVTYNKVTNNWNMFQRDETASTTTTAFPNPYGLSIPGSGVTGIGDVADVAGFVNVALPYFGMILNHGASSVNFYLDNYKVTMGQGSSANFYLASASDCSNLNNWWSNANGTGTHPASFTADSQIFNIFTTGATIGSDWSVIGGGSKVVLGNGTAANSLTIDANAFLSGTIKLAANTTLTINHLTIIPVFESGGVDATSTVVFNGTDAQNVPGSTYGNLSILTQGILGAKATGSISVVGNLNIDANSILSMDTSKLGAVNTLTGTGALKTKFAFSSALPGGITWPYSVYYNYTSANTNQIIAPGTYVNLDTTGGPRNFTVNDLSISGTFIPGLGTMTAANRITFNGTTGQSLPANFPPATALIITNTSTDGVILSADEVIPDATNLELSGNLKADFNENMGTLSLLNNSVLTLGATIHSVLFTSSSASNPGPADFWTAGKTLIIKGWTGMPNASGTNGKVYVGLDNTGLNATQLGQISFEGFGVGATQLANGEVVPQAMTATASNELVNFKFAPNPVTDKITLSNSEILSQVTVLNLLGQKVLVVTPNQLTATVDMSSLHAATYFIEVLSEGKKATVKVLKQ